MRIGTLNSDRVVIVFDLDGTLTAEETLPLVADAFGVEDQINALTRDTIKGRVPFAESLIKRVNVLRAFEPQEISEVIAGVKILDEVADFIRRNSESCVIATGNLDCWTGGLLNRFECESYSSLSSVGSDGRVKLETILDKAQLVREFQSLGNMVVFVGDGNNDVEAMRVADVAIATGIVHQPAPAVMAVTDFVVYSEKALVRLLEQVFAPFDGPTVVIPAAGIGSRLGLGQSKSLVSVGGRSLIEIQLNLLSEVEDIRIVVGFQAFELIEEANRFRNDLIYVFNHEYFTTRTWKSLALGAVFANDFVIGWDGDLLVHPDDISRCLDISGEWLGVSREFSEDGVFVDVDRSMKVVGFGRISGDLEWTGPYCLKRNRIHDGQGDVYSLIQLYLPMEARELRALDVDTYHDFRRAEKFVDSWPVSNFKASRFYDGLAKNIRDPRETRNKALDFTEYDVAFVASHAENARSLLDLGAGSGLLLNRVANQFETVTAVEKYAEFSQFIDKSDFVTVINDDLLYFTTTETYDLVTAFGVMNFFSAHEAFFLYKKFFDFVNPGGKLIVKHQMGVDGDVSVDGYSAELATDYFSQYRSVEHEQALLARSGFKPTEAVDIYPSEYNRWPSTHFYAIVCIRPD